MSRFSLTGKVPVIAIVEHSRTVSGRRDPLSGATTTENIKLGWFIHLGFEGGTYAFRCDNGEKPDDLREGEMLTVRLSKD